MGSAQSGRCSQEQASISYALRSTAVVLRAGSRKWCYTKVHFPVLQLVRRVLFECASFVRRLLLPSRTKKSCLTAQPPTSLFPPFSSQRSQQQLDSRRGEIVSATALLSGLQKHSRSWTLYETSFHKYINEGEVVHCDDYGSMTTVYIRKSLFAMQGHMCHVRPPSGISYLALPRADSHEPVFPMPR